jgi:hypothetical protein
VENGMTISGELARWKLRARTLTLAVTCLGIGGGGFWFFLHLVERSRDRLALDQFTQTALIAFFPLMGAIGFGVSMWADGWRIVKFTCDEHSFRFRKFRADPETRDLSEIAGIQEVYGRGHDLRGYRVAFRDGAEVFLEIGLPNATALADRLS